MNRLVLTIAALSLFSCDASDEDILRPELCVFTTAAVENPADRANAVCPAPARSFQSGQAFYIRHTLPEHVEVDAPVSITIETACPGSAVTTEHFHDERVALIPALAPAGAECSLIVTARILNETARYISQSTSASCVPACPSSGEGGDGGSR